MTLSLGALLMGLGAISVRVSVLHIITYDTACVLARVSQVSGQRLQQHSKMRPVWETEQVRLPPLLRFLLARYHFSVQSYYSIHQSCLENG